MQPCKPLGSPAKRRGLFLTKINKDYSLKMEVNHERFGTTIGKNYPLSSQFL